MDSYARDPVNYALVAAGAGYNTNRFKLDAAVQFRWTSFRASQTLSPALVGAASLAPSAVGTASANEWRFKVSVIYRIADTDKLGAVLKKIFG
jgi:hypothetical protein